MQWAQNAQTVENDEYNYGGGYSMLAHIDFSFVSGRSNLNIT
jgi:hypothetical protein